ncbi:hypothetical protein JCM10212_006121 [Sporobolomyces blumeae]
MAASSKSRSAPKPVKKKARLSNRDASTDDEGQSGGEGSDVEQETKRKGKKAKGTVKTEKGRKPKKQNKGAAGDEEDEEEEEDPKPKRKNGTTSKAKKGKRKARDDSDDDDDDGDDGDYAGEEEGEEDDSAEFDEDSDDGGKNTRVVRDITKVPAPRVSADTSVILPTTMEFLAELRDHNDRDWFQTNDARYRHALANFKTFMTSWIDKAAEADWQLPHMPVKDLIHRIYRDVRFSKNKTPYKTNLAFSHSRTGRKGPFAFYYFQISPGGRSLLAAGCWQPMSTELKAIRAAILRDPKPLRDAISAPEFVQLYGNPKPRMDGKRTSIFGLSDQLKNAPKIEGVDKNHKDIDLLKCRSIAVETTFTDDEVLEDDFLDKVIEKVKVTAPFVQLLNEFISPSPPSDDDGEEEAEDEDDGGDGEPGDGSDDEAEGEEADEDGDDD